MRSRKVYMVDGVPRRIREDLMVPAELAILAAAEAVEKMPASVLLTDAVVLLVQARGRVADFVDLEAERASISAESAD